MSRILPILLLLAFFLSLASLETAILAAKEKRVEKAYHDTDQTASFLITDVAEYDGAVKLSGRFIQIGDCNEKIKATVMLFHNAETAEGACETGDILSGEFHLEQMKTEGLFKNASLSDGTLLSATANGTLETVGRNGKPLAVKLAVMRRAVRKALDDSLTENGAAMMSALLLADKSSIDKEVKEGFSALGISHLFAVSGLHLSILMGMLAFLFQKLGIGQRIAYPILASVILLYVILTAFAPSLLRAGGMLLLFYLSRFSKRHRDSVTSLLAATACIVTVSPHAIRDLGLLMSFSATLGILLIASPCLKAIDQTTRRLGNGRVAKLGGLLLSSFLSSIVLSLCATAAILPILYHLKSRVFLFVFLSNLVFTPFFSLLIFLMPLLLLSLPFKPVTACLSWVINGLSEAVFKMAIFGKRLAPLSFSLDYAFMPFLIVLLYASLFFLLTRKKKRVLLPLVSILLFFLIANLGISISRASLVNSESVYYATDGKNDRLEVTYGEKGLLVDFSASGSFLTASVSTSMERNPSIAIDSLMLTSCRAIHLSALEEYLRDETLAHLILPSGTPYGDSFAALAEQYGVQVTRYTPGDAVVWNGIVITTYPDTNEVSVTAVKIETAHKDFLYVKENAAILYDIRFGVLAEHHDVLFYGSFGSEASGYPFTFDADVIVYSGDAAYFAPSDAYVLLDESKVFTDSRKDPS